MHSSVCEGVSEQIPSVKWSLRSTIACETVSFLPSGRLRACGLGRFLRARAVLHWATGHRTSGGEVGLVILTAPLKLPIIVTPQPVEDHVR